MDEDRVVFDISSDEDAAFDEPQGDDYSWLSKLLCDDAENSDEVVVVGEIKSKSSKAAGKDEDDDDCIVLDGDPEKDVPALSDQAPDEDDLVVVGQKGQVACRDFPHSRHLCAKFPFRSTAHELHCDLCHCYVCDVVSPCARWGTGASNTDHCHATEKDEFWRTQRIDFRIHKDPDAALCDTALSQLNQTPHCDTTQLASNSLPQMEVSRPVIIPPPNRLSIPIIGQGRIRQSRPLLSRNRCQTPSVSQQSPLLRVRNTVICRDRTLNANNLGMFKRSWTAEGVSKKNQSNYSSANNTGGVRASQCANNFAPRVTSNNEINVRWFPSMNQDSCAYQSFSQTGTGSVFVNPVPSQSPAYSHQIPQPQVYSQPIPQPPAYSQPIPPPLACSQPTSELQACSQPLPQSHVSTNRISQSSNGQNINEYVIQRQNSTASEFSDLDVMVNVSRSNQEPTVENCQLYKTGSTNELLPVQDFNSNCNGSAKLHYNDLEFDSWYPESHSVQVTEGYVPATFDAGMLLFDFETSFNSLTHV